METLILNFLNQCTEIFFDARTAVSTKTNHFLHRCVFTIASLLCVRQTLRQHGCTTGRLSRQRVFGLLGINEIHVFVRAERVFFFCYLGLCVIKDRRGIKNIDLTGFNEECLICQTYGLIIFFFFQFSSVCVGLELVSPD